MESKKFFRNPMLCGLSFPVKPGDVYHHSIRKRQTVFFSPVAFSDGFYHFYFPGIYCPPLLDAWKRSKAPGKKPGTAHASSQAPDRTENHGPFAQPADVGQFFVVSPGMLVRQLFYSFCRPLYRICILLFYSCFFT